LPYSLFDSKTEVLSEFAVQQKASRNIFFVRARNLDTFESLLGKIATDIGFDMLENKQLNWKVWQALSLSERLKTFYDWLGKECNRGSLLIIDDLDAFNDADIQKALHCEAHHVIVSTRNSILRLSPRERYSNDVPISRMDDEDLISIMRESGLDEELELFTEKDLQAIATLCHGHPFAASLVVPFVVEHLTSYDDPAKELVRRFKSSDPHARQTFLNFKLGGMSGSLWSSFEKSFALLHGESSPAATLFGFLSFLETSSDSIFLFLGQEKSRKGRVGQSLPDALVLEADFETDVATWLETLRKVSLYVFEPFLSSRKTINFHPFVLDFAQLRLGSDGRIRIIQQIFIFCCEAVKTSKASGYFILPQVYHCLAICRGFGIDLKTLSLPDHVWQWLQGFEFQNPFEPPEHILEDEATVGAEENVVDEKMVRDHITLCVQERKWFEEVENMISKHGLSDGCDARIVHLLKSHSRLVQHLEHFPETLAFLPGLENATDDLIWIITLTRRSGRISYPDLFHRLDIFKRRLHRGKCEAE